MLRYDASHVGYIAVFSAESSDTELLQRGNAVIIIVIINNTQDRAIIYGAKPYARVHFGSSV